jgi:hypothetical protein
MLTRSEIMKRPITGLEDLSLQISDNSGGNDSDDIKGKVKGKAIPVIGHEGP